MGDYKIHARKKVGSIVENVEIPIKDADSRRDIEAHYDVFKLDMLTRALKVIAGDFKEVQDLTDMPPSDNEVRLMEYLVLNNQIMPDLREIPLQIANKLNRFFINKPGQPESGIAFPSEGDKEEDGFNDNTEFWKRNQSGTNFLKSDTEEPKSEIKEPVKEVTGSEQDITEAIQISTAQDSIAEAELVSGEVSVSGNIPPPNETEDTMFGQKVAPAHETKDQFQPSP